MSKSFVTFKTKPNALKNAINSSTITANCPNCNNKLSFLGNQIGNTIICPHCNANIRLEDNDYSKELNELQKSFDKIFK